MRPRAVFALASCSVVAFTACTPAEAPPPVFRPGIAEGPVPWTAEPAASDGPLRFVILGDRTGGMYPGVFEGAFPKIDLLKPDLVMSVGDVTETWLAEDRDEVVAAWEELDELAAGLDAPMFYTVGNHDVADETTADVWRERYGPSYYHFVYKDALFISLDTEDPPGGIPEFYREAMAAMELRRTDLDAGNAAFAEVQRRMASGRTRSVRPIGAISDAQADSVIRAIEENPDVTWTFLFAHQPSWEQEPLDPNFLRIEEALAGRDYTFFAGHYHAYRFTERNGRDYVRLATTGGGWRGNGRPGEFDHVTWVTMTDDGPVIANIELDGIFDKTGERTKLREPSGGSD